MRQASSVDHRGGARDVQGILKMHDTTDGGRERTSSGYVVRRPDTTVYCTAVPTPEQRGGGVLFPDAPALLMKGMPYALNSSSDRERITLRMAGLARPRPQRLGTAGCAHGAVKSSV